MKKYEIVKEKKYFDDIIHSGKYKSGKYIIIYNKESNFDFPRFGVAVGKKIGNAVTRNKYKRIIRMIITTNKNMFKNGKDYIIIVKRSVLEASYSDIEKELKIILENW